MYAQISKTSVSFVFLRLAHIASLCACGPFTPTLHVSSFQQLSVSNFQPLVLKSKSSVSNISLWASSTRDKMALISTWHCRTSYYLHQLRAGPKDLMLINAKLNFKTKFTNIQNNSLGTKHQSDESRCHCCCSRAGRKAICASFVGICSYL